MWHTLAQFFDCPFCGFARRAGLYRWQVCVAAAQNALYGSTLSPPRQQQVREAVLQHMDSTTMEQDSLWQLLCPEICSQMKIDASQPGKVEELYESMRTHSLLYAKGERALRLGPCAPKSPLASNQAFKLLFQFSPPPNQAPESLQPQEKTNLHTLVTL